MNQPASQPPRPIVPPRRDVFFSATMHLRNLLRVDRTLTIRQAIQSAVTPGARVLDAGCGTGLLSFLAVAAGAGEVVAIDRDHVDMARALARENGLADRIRFLDGDLTAPDDLDIAGRFDVLFAFIYTNHVVIDEPRSATVCALRRRFGTATCVTVPNRVRYLAIPCDWPALDHYTEQADMRRAVAEIEARYGLRLGPLADSLAAEIGFNRSRPVTFGDYDWTPQANNCGYHHRRSGGRFLGDPSPVAAIAYDTGIAFDRLPPQAELTIGAAGTFNAVMWIQELWFNDSLIWSTEVFSPLDQPLPVRPGDRPRVALDDRWRATNILQPA